MTSFPRSPRLLKGAIVAIPATVPVPSVIVFQYNPDTMTRSLQANAATGGGEGDAAAPGEALRLKGPPRESISLSVQLDATDALEHPEQPAGVAAVVAGVHPALAQLELLLYPPSALAIANEALAAMGVIEVLPPEAPLTLFVWGLQRVVPVRITSMEVEEEAYDNALNPVRAKVGLRMQVLTYLDLGMTSVGGSLFLAHQIAREVMGAAAGVAGAVQGTASFSASASFNLSL